MTELQNSLPPGWDCKLDPRTNKYYYINHYTRLTTWEDPRNRYRQIHGNPSNVPNMSGESIPMQHGSPDLGRRNYVYPSQICPQPAFQIPTSQYGPKSTIQVQEMNSVMKMSPVATKIVHAMTATRASPSLGRTQETSLTTVQDTEQSVAKISAMFPTVSETHIRLLLKKYYNREAVVISALQVEKHPITTPGPFTTPPPARNIQTHIQPLTMTPPFGMRNGSRTASPLPPRPGSGKSSNSTDFRNSPKPHSSPKMKLRYMKSLFPKAEETIILDVLGNNDNNVQKTSEALKEMGYEKIDSMKLSKKAKSQPEKTVRIKDDKQKDDIPVVPKIKTLQEKEQMKTSLQEKYKDIPERVIVIALESVDYDKNKAVQILEIMVKEEKNSPKTSRDHSEDSKKEKGVSRDTLQVPKRSPIKPIISPNKSIINDDKTDSVKARRTKEKHLTFRNEEEKVSSQDIGYQSIYLTTTVGANPKLVKGSDEGMLLEDYVTWDGPDPNLRSVSRLLAKGPDSCLLSKRIYEPHGANKGLCRGPALGLAKGSIYSQLKSQVVGESRGK